MIRLRHDAVRIDPSMVLDASYIAPIMVSGGTLDSIQRDMESFKNMDSLPGFVSLVKAVKEETGSVVNRLLNRFAR